MVKQTATTKQASDTNGINPKSCSPYVARPNEFQIAYEPLHTHMHTNACRQQHALHRTHAAIKQKPKGTHMEELLLCRRCRQ